MDITFNVKKPRTTVIIDSGPSNDINEPSHESITDEEGFEHTKDDLTIDGILTTEAQLRKLKLDENKRNENKTSNRLKELTKIVIMLSLDKMNLHPLTDVSKLTVSQKEKLQSIMRTYENLNVETIESEFSVVVNSKILHDRCDIHRLPIYDI